MSWPPKEWSHFMLTLGEWVFKQLWASLTVLIPPKKGYRCQTLDLRKINASTVSAAYNQSKNQPNPKTGETCILLVLEMLLPRRWIWKVHQSMCAPYKTASKELWSVERDLIQKSTTSELWLTNSLWFPRRIQTSTQVWFGQAQKARPWEKTLQLVSGVS